MYAATTTRKPISQLGPLNISMTDSAAVSSSFAPSSSSAAPEYPQPLSLDQPSQPSQSFEQNATVSVSHDREYMPYTYSFNPPTREVDVRNKYKFDSPRSLTEDVDIEQDENYMQMVAHLILKSLEKSSLAEELQKYRDAVSKAFKIPEKIMKKVFSFEKMASLLNPAETQRIFLGKPISAYVEKTKENKEEKQKKTKQTKQTKRVKKDDDEDDEDDEDDDDDDDEDDEDDDDDDDDDDEEDDDDDDDDDDEDDDDEDDDKKKSKISKKIDKIVKKVAADDVKEPIKETNDDEAFNAHLSECEEGSDEKLTEESKKKKEKKENKENKEKNNHKIAKALRRALRENQVDYSGWVFTTINDNKISVTVKKPDQVKGLVALGGKNSASSSEKTVIFTDENFL